MKRLMVGLVVGLALLCGTVGVLVLSQAPQGFVEQTGRAFTPSPAPRLMFPYSLVPGGVRSVAELREAFRKNPAYAAQFPGFDFTRAHIVHLHRWAYVSFLKGKKVFWTSKLQLIDEDVLTDGKYFIRLKCGNAISPVPQVPTEPSVTNEVLNTPELPPVDVPPATTEVTVQPVVNPTAGPVYAGGSPISGLGTPPLFIYIPPSGGGPPPVSVPEPSEWCLALVGLFAIAFSRVLTPRCRLGTLKVEEDK